jgi:hypothetical protein
VSDNGHGQTLHEYANYPSTERLQSRNRWKKKKANSISLTHIYMITHFPGLVQALLMAIVLLFMDSDYPFKLFCQLKVWKIRPKRQVVHIFTMATYKYIRGHNYPSSVHQCNILVYWPGLYTIHSWTTKQNVIQIKSSTS